MSQRLYVVVRNWPDEGDQFVGVYSTQSRATEAVTADESESYSHTVTSYFLDDPPHGVP